MNESLVKQFYREIFYKFIWDNDKLAFALSQVAAEPWIRVEIAYVLEKYIRKENLNFRVFQEKDFRDILVVPKCEELKYNSQNFKDKLKEKKDQTLYLELKCPHGQDESNGKNFEKFIGNDIEKIKNFHFGYICNLLFYFLEKGLGEKEYRWYKSPCLNWKVLKENWEDGYKETGFKNIISGPLETEVKWKKFRANVQLLFLKKHKKI